jgi:GcrA cell cycle regulator
MSDKWSQERVNYLVELFNKGVSGGEAAKELTRHFHETFTRCSVVAKWNRMGFMRGQETRKQRSKIVQRVRVAKQAAQEQQATRRQSALAEVLAKAPRELLPVEEPRPADLIKFEELTSRSCRWIYGDTKSPDHGYCGKPTVLGQSWCEHHCRRAFAPPVVRPRAPKPFVVPTFADLEKV